MHDVERLDESAGRIDLDDLAVEVDDPIGRFARPACAGRPVRPRERSMPPLPRELRIGDRRPQAIGRRRDVDLVALGRRHGGTLQVRLEPDHRADDRALVGRDPTVVHLPDRDRVQEVVLVPAGLRRGDQAGSLQDPQVAHDPESLQRRQLTLELGERLPIAVTERIEERPPARIREGTKHVIHRWR
jgi:hypothetical protein